MTSELAIRATIWLSVLAWALAEVLRRGDRQSAARASYSAGAMLLAAHTAAAFQFRHGWSHAAAFAETAARSAAVTGVSAGAGLYLNYLLIALWAADAAWWWMRPRAYRDRLFLFFLFMFINGAVVFANGPMRIVGAAAVATALFARFAPAAAQPAQETA